LDSYHLNHLAYLPVLKVEQCDHLVGKVEQCDHLVGKVEQCDHPVGKVEQCDHPVLKVEQCDHPVQLMLDENHLTIMNKEGNNHLLEEPGNEDPVEEVVYCSISSYKTVQVRYIGFRTLVPDLENLPVVCHLNK
jgi:hypothetical protein